MLAWMTENPKTSVSDVRKKIVEKGQGKMSWECIRGYMKHVKELFKPQRAR